MPFRLWGGPEGEALQSNHDVCWLDAHVGGGPGTLLSVDDIIA